MTNAYPPPDGPINYDLADQIKETVRHLLRKDFATQDYPTTEEDVLIVGFAIRRQGDTALVKGVKIHTKEPHAQPWLHRP